MSDDLAHLDFTVSCELTDPNGPCTQPATHIANIHMHRNEMPRVALCDHHRDRLHAFEEGIIANHGHGLCSVCRQSMHPEDIIRNEEAL
jgi:hypothetical protein